MRTKHPARHHRQDAEGHPYHAVSSNYVSTIQPTMRPLLTIHPLFNQPLGIVVCRGCSGENSCRQRSQHYGIREILGQG